MIVGTAFGVFLRLFSNSQCVLPLSWSSLVKKDATVFNSLHFVLNFNSVEFGIFSFENRFSWSQYRGYESVPFVVYWKLLFFRLLLNNSKLLASTSTSTTTSTIKRWSRNDADSGATLLTSRGTNTIKTCSNNTTLTKGEVELILLGKTNYYNFKLRSTIIATQKLHTFSKC